MYMINTHDKGSMIQCTSSKAAVLSVWYRFCAAAVVLRDAAPLATFTAARTHSAVQPVCTYVCVVCHPGSGGNPCAQCAAGSFSGGGNLSTPSPACQPCHAGNTTARNGSRSEIECTGEGLRTI